MPALGHSHFQAQTSLIRCQALFGGVPWPSGDDCAGEKYFGFLPMLWQIDYRLQNHPAAAVRVSGQSPLQESRACGGSDGFRIRTERGNLETISLAEAPVLAHP